MRHKKKIAKSITTSVSPYSRAVIVDGKVAWQMNEGSESVFGEWLWDEYGFEGVTAVMKAIETIQEGGK